MMRNEAKILPSIRMVQTVTPHPLLLKSYIIANERSSERIKPYIMFNEMFPTKVSNKNVDIVHGYERVDDTFHRAMGPVLTVGQFFGVMPVMGVLKPEASQLSFSWIAWRVGFTLLSLTASIGVTTLCILRMVFTGVDIFKTISTVFYGSTCMVLILFLQLAPKWPSIGAAMAFRERNRTSHMHPKRRSLRSRFRICCFAILFPALVEHIFAVFSGVSIAYDCSKELSLLETYFLNSYAQIFLFIDYSTWKGFLLQLINLESAFNWNFMDLFIIVVSIGLTDRFDQLNERLEAVKGKHLPEAFWKSAREEYAQLTRLVKKIDNKINKIVLLSFANNLYFICLQLFNTLNNAKEEKASDCGNSPYKHLRALAQIMYFTFSFGLLMTRFIVVSLSAACIHSSSRRPAATLYAIPSTSYGTETHRFLEQVVSDVVALTGLNFFNVTRGLVLTIAGTIVTYELVLVQFNSSPPPVQANITISETCGTIPIKT